MGTVHGGYTGRRRRSVTLLSRIGVPLVFKSSFDKANRTSSKSFQRPGMAEGLKVMANSAAKVRLAGNPKVMVCERGTMFGYNDFIVDPRNLEGIRGAANCPVVADITHSLQQLAGKKESEHACRFLSSGLC